MKPTANKITIRKMNSRTYQATIKQGRSTSTYDFPSYNNARSFVRRNFKQVGSYN